MIGRDCRCPGCGTCDAASEVERLRERLAVERTPNGAGKWNAERVLREKAERERDEARAQVKAWQAEELARRTERDEARAEVERLRAALRSIAEGFGRIDGSWDDPSARQVDGYFRGFAEAALEKKP